MKNRHNRLYPVRRARHYWFAKRHYPMIHNPWLNRCAALALLLMVYAAGYAGGKEQATLANHCYTELRP